MRISGAPGAGPLPADRHPAERAPAQEPIRTALPALVPIHAAARSHDAPRIRPHAALLAQLVATAEDVPGTRARRRADPAAVISCYAAMAALKLTIR
jgi:hypothetical protein